MKRTASILFSMTTTGILLLVFAAAIGYATFVENDFGTVTAKIQVYNSRWFEALLVLLVINLTGSIVVNKLISRKKWTGFLFHASFIVIFAGAAVTRFTGTEGNMHIREGSFSNEILSDETYVTVTASDGQDTRTLSRKVKFSGHARNRFRETLHLASRAVTVESMEFIPSATRTVTADSAGGPVIELVAVGMQQQRMEFILEKGEERNFNNIVFSFEHPTDATTVLIREGSRGPVLTALGNVLSVGHMGSEMTVLPLREEFPLTTDLVYQIGHISFILKQYVPKGRTQLVRSPESKGRPATDAFRARVTVGDLSEVVDVLGSTGLPGQPSSVTVGGVQVSVTYGSVLEKLPFSIFLDDFQIERYPGSNSPSSFASEVTLVDEDRNVERPFRIFMNNILKYKGYRFFQSSYDQDEMGTILSVNYDAWGTAITYAGYFLMMLGMALTMLNRNSRFQRLIRALSKLKAQRAMLLAALMTAGTALLSQAQPAAATGTIDRSHARSFGELLIQSNEGRIEPVNAVASKILRKVYKNNSFEGMAAVEVFLDMNADPASWASRKIIKVSNRDIKKMLGVSGNYVSYNEVVAGGYKLAKQVEEAYRKKPGARNKLDKEVMTLDERVNICYLVLSGEMLKIFPIPGDPNHKWIYLRGSEQDLPVENREFAIRVLSNYYRAVNTAKTTGDWSQAGLLLDELKENQAKYGSAVIPDRTKIRLENFYTNFNIFSKLARLYLVAGLLLLAGAFVSIFRPGTRLRKAFNAGIFLVFILFVLHTAGLILRWYISGHAPWSNGYESMVFISWAACLSGLIFAKKSEMAVAVTTILSASTLLIAGLSWMSPEITNLAPVLKSYWLIIHVAIVTASYGFLAIGALLGLTNMVLIILRNEKNTARVNITIRELVYIIQIALIIGLFLLTIGSFLGGVWANESWGRYWGWDPKETWAMVTILVYSFIVHMHKIPGLKGYLPVSIAAVLGFGSVLMTYFGVNYYLSGLHSYASGDAIPVPKGVYIAVAALLVLIVSALVANRRSGAGYVPDELTGE